MSLGYGASCRKAAEDDKTILYEYSVYNLVNPNWRDTLDTYDGIIMISKSDDGGFQSFSIDNSSNAFRLSEEGIDLVAVRLFHCLYVKYKDNGVFPDSIDVNY